MFVVIRIEEGKKYIVGEVYAKGNKVFSQDEIKNPLR